VLGVTVEDLDMGSLADYLRRRSPAFAANLGVEAFAVRMGLLAQVSGGAIAPTVAGLLSFGLCPQLFRPEWGLSAIRVQGLSIADPVIAHEDFEGSVASLLQQGLDFVQSHSQSVPELLGPSMSREEFPIAAVREILVNALVHRDLRLPGRVGLRIFDDRLEVSSPGGPPAPLPLAELAQRGGLSLPRNPLLAAVSRGLGLVEQVGRGLPLARSSVSAGTAEAIQFQTSHHEVMVSLPSCLRAPSSPRLGN
jgi:ATP-dependent DNA helicase RecG